MPALCHATCKILVITALSPLVLYIRLSGFGLTAARAHSPDRAGATSAAEKMNVDQDLTPLMVAVRDQEFETVSELLRGKPDLGARDSEGWTAVSYAALNRDTTIISALIDAGADINTQDNEGMTPLMRAASYGKTKVAEVLLSAGAELNAQNNKGQTALMLAALYKSNELIRLLREAGASPRGGVDGAEATNPDQTPQGPRPSVLKFSPPMYTDKARHDWVQGVVRLRILVAKDGSVAKMRAITGLPGGLTREAYRAAYRSTFIPATKDGEL